MRKKRSKLAGAATLLLLLSPTILRTAGSTTATITTGTDNNSNIADDASSSTATITDNTNTYIADDDASSKNTNRNNLYHNAENEENNLATVQENEKQEERILSSSDDPTHHYFCGRGFADASSSCEYPCPSGSLVDCPSGMLCYYDTPCNIQDVAGYSPPTHTPTPKPFDRWAWRPPSQAPWSANDPRLSYYCGSSWEDASSRCGVWCKEGDHDQCPYGQSCFSDTLCKAKIPSPSSNQLWGPPTSTPYASDDRRLTFYCGSSWQHASETCGTWCPDSDDDRCGYGQSCFSDTNCKYTVEPTGSPTYPPPTKRPTLRPTGPSQSPTSPPLPLLPKDPSNNMFCGSDWSQASATCSLASHCPNGIGDCPYNQYCWTDVTCDVRDYIPWAEGGNVGKPSHQEIAMEMGLSFRSDDPTDHYFCGATTLRASEYCHSPCPDDTPLRCRHGEYCQHDTACDARVMSGFGITEAPSSMPAIPYDSRENYKFCGMSWGHANGCGMKWCGDGSGCPGEQSCYADTECNIQDRGPLPPSATPTFSPLPYDHKSNHFFCGISYTEAAAQCSLETYCRTGLHSECGGISMYCWPGVTCNAQDMVVPTAPQTASPTIDSQRPTKSPSEYEDPRNSRFCGVSWSDASDSCKNGRRPRWCPRGTDEECRGSGVCWADTMCNISEFTLPPSLKPTNNPTEPATWSPTDSPVEYSDPSNTSFCGRSYMEAEAYCSIETHCPNMLHTECSAGQYCWVILKPACNIHEIIGPTPPPTRRPTQSPTTRFLPSAAPSAPPTDDPTERPTGSPLPETDGRNFFYCGTSWSDATSKCSVSCPLMTGCPPGETCWAQTSCSTSPRVPEEATPQFTNAVELVTSPPTKSPITQYPTPRPETNPPTVSPTARPTMRPTNKNIPAVVINNPPTTRPTMTNKAEVQIAYFPRSEAALPKPPIANAQRIQHIVESIKSSLEESILVIETRSGALLPSSLYTYNGFLASLLFYTQTGLNGNYFFLGTAQSASNAEAPNLEIQYGITNLALFLANMMETIAYERCDPSYISCGIPALESTFEERNIRVDCFPSSSEEGMECPSEIGCACVLGFMNHYIGAQSESAFTGSHKTYSGVDFCETNLLRSICSRRINEGAELRWITAMTHWVFFVQQYNDGGWTYLDELHEFVKGNMLDVSFMGAVAGLSVLDGPATPQDSSNQRFTQNFFKTLMVLSEGVSQSMSQSESKPATQTTSPSKRMTPVRTPAPTHRPTTNPSSNSPKTAANLASIWNPTHVPIDKPVSRTSPPTLNTRDGGTENSLLQYLSGSSPPTMHSNNVMTAGNSQLPLSSDDSSPTMSPSDVSMADENIQQADLIFNGSSPSLMSSTSAAENSEPSVLNPQATTADSSSLSPTRQRNGEYGNMVWYGDYMSSRSEGTRNKVCDCIRIIMIFISFYLFVY